MCSAIIVAGGNGTRIGGNIKKQFLDINNKPILFYSIEAFYDLDFINEIIIVLPKDCLIDYKSKILETYKDKTIKVVAGGVERYDSVLNGLLNSSSDYVLIHDGVRPFVSKKVIQNVYEMMIKHNACIPVVKVKDTIKTCQDNKVIKSNDRNKLCIVQTPQGFKKELILNAYKQTDFNNLNITDDAMIVEAFGTTVYTTDGDYFNIKITTQEDLIFAKILGV